MRISDWSSDVCSSDLRVPDHRAVGDAHVIEAATGLPQVARALLQRFAGPENGGVILHDLLHLEADLGGRAGAVGIQQRSEERRVGNGCVSTCRSRGAAYHSKKNTTT